MSMEPRESTPSAPGRLRPRRRWAITAAILTLALLVAGTVARARMGDAPAGAGAGPAASMPPMPVDVDTARRDTVVDAVRATGRIEAVQAVELRPDQEGRVTRLLFREGQVVAAGTPLVRIDDAVLRAQAERARADRDLAHQQLARVHRLRAENASAPADLERAEAAARVADAALALLELQIARTTVHAPFAGVVGQRFVSAGDYVTTATPLLTLQTVDPQRAVIEVPERHALRLRPGQTIEFTVAAQPERLFRARVDFIDPVVQDANRTIVVKARAPNADRLLRPGMFVEARLATATRADAVVVPEDAVQPLRTANVVWAVVDGRASRRVVQLGARAQGVVEIVGGVSPGELVVVGGLERMAEGMPVAPQPRRRPAPTAEAGATSPAAGG
ncbi:MAG TPA: efflux RND transporter periplasmic adaptor subunit [Gemmatimonadaceae bacterium]|nr:efflux RND transporter periplasmic adaptor subunit [Gemmatimonadaceae bacterium]